MFVCKAKRGAPERCFARVGSDLTCKHHTKLERRVRDSSLLQMFVNYSCKMLYYIGPNDIELKAVFCHLRKG
jgi:hypothetical protein